MRKLPSSMMKLLQVSGEIIDSKRNPLSGRDGRRARASSLRLECNANDMMHWLDSPHPYTAVENRLQ